MPDRTTKTLLALIATALWIHLFSPLWEPATAQAQGETYLRRIARAVASIESDVGRIQRGTCTNSEIC